MKLDNRLLQNSLAALFLLSATTLSWNASAATCLPGGAPPLAVSDVTFRGSDADNCGGPYDGNNSNQDINAIAGGELKFGGAAWGAEIKDDSPGGAGSGTGSFLGLDWTLSVTAGQTGSWTLSVADPGSPSLPVTVDILFILKASTSFAAYLFTGETFNATGDSNGTWAIKFLNNGGQIPDLSHAAIYLREGTPNIPGVPIPAAVWLFGSGLLGLLGLARKKWTNA